MTMIPSVVASESGRGQTRGLRSFGVADCIIDSRVSRMNGWKAGTKERNSRVCENSSEHDSIQSTTRHEKPCGKPGGPPSKPKYSSVTDSEAVL